jgi:uncharacterized protein YqgV (UPF0045/DUF77 family)
MGVITAQVSLYPLQQVSIGPAIREAVQVFGEHGLGTRMGEMNTLVWGRSRRASMLGRRRSTGPRSAAT